ncbi:MAG: protein-L-isoaspartate O-methyltransferase, partial [Campylobacter sp.]|nr:protein-L-isoaspartate O-methyltransferase [Campylobacter sp.]
IWRSYAPYDRILLSCFCQSVPPKLFDQLRDGGILVAPVAKDGKQYITQYKKFGNQIICKTLDECVFVPLLDGTEQR